MLIGEIVKKTGLTKDAIRFYEKRGLITVGRSASSYNNYKEYSHDTFKRLLIIKRIKSIGFTLKEIGKVLDLFDLDMASCKAISEMVEEKIDDIEVKVQELKRVQQALRNGLDSNNPNCTPDIHYKNCKAIYFDLIKSS